MAKAGKFVKNIDNRTASKNYFGQDVASGTYYEMDETEVRKFGYEDSFIQDDLPYGYSLIARSDDGTKDITSLSEAISFLRNENLTPLNASKTAIKSESFKPEDDSVIVVTHNFCDPTTWYGDSVFVSGVDLDVISGTNNTKYSFGHTNIIDVCHGRLTNERELYDPYCVKVWVDGVEQKPEWDEYASGIAEGLLGAEYPFRCLRKGEIGNTVSLVFTGLNTIGAVLDAWNAAHPEAKVMTTAALSSVPIAATLTLQAGDYKVDYENGEIEFYDSTTGQVDANFYYENGSTFYLKPKAGKQIDMYKSEVQFTKDIKMYTAFGFEVWVYNPFDLPNKIQYRGEYYKNLRDFINTGNLGQGEIPIIDDMPAAVVVFPFDYTGRKILKSSQGAELRITLEDDYTLEGTFGTATFYVNVSDEE